MTFRHGTLMDVRLFSLGLRRWQQQTVDVWLSHHGTRTAVFCGAAGWRTVVSYENPQAGAHMLNVDLKIPMSQPSCGPGVVVQVGQDVVYASHQRWALDDLHDARWGVEGYSNSRAATVSEECTVNSLDIRCDMFALISLANGVPATHIHFENVDVRKHNELINVWYTSAESDTACFLHVFRCAEYTHRVNSKRYSPRKPQRFSLVLSIDVLAQLVALVECCDAEDFAGRGDDLLRIGMDGTVWMCTAAGCRLSIKTVCCNAKVAFE